MGLFKKGLSLYGATWGVPVRPSTKKERDAKTQRKLLQQQNSLLAQIAVQGASPPPEPKEETVYEYRIRVTRRPPFIYNSVPVLQRAGLSHEEATRVLKQREFIHVRRHRVAVQSIATGLIGLERAD